MLLLGVVLLEDADDPRDEFGFRDAPITERLMRAHVSRSGHRELTFFMTRNAPGPRTILMVSSQPSCHVPNRLECVLLLLLDEQDDASTHWAVPSPINIKMTSPVSECFPRCCVLTKHAAKHGRALACDFISHAAARSP